MRTVDFAGYAWECKESQGLVGPGPNRFSSSNVTVDSGGLHLTIAPDQDGWSCAEAVVTTPLGYGTYSFSVETSLQELDSPMVFGAFLYESDTQEIDIEVSPKMVGKGQGQFVVQPGSVRGNLAKFTLSNELPFVGTIVWEPGGVRFSVRESSEEAVWTYPSAGIEHPDTARWIFNLWLYRGKKPKRPHTLTISGFTFEKA